MIFSLYRLIVDRNPSRVTPPLHRSYPYILLSGEYVNSASVNDRLSLTLTPDDAMALNAGSAETTLKELSFSLRLTAWGKAEIAVSSSFVSFNHMLIFDADGMLAENGTVYGGKTYVSSALPQGGYTAVAFNSNTRFSVFGSLDQMQTAGLVEGKDYAAASFRIQDDVTTTLSLTVPALTLPEAENAHRASISLYPGSVVLGKVFRVKVEYELAKALTGDLNITLPSDSEVVYVTEDNHVYQTEQVYNPKTHTVTVPVSDTKGSFFIGLYISDPGVHIINAALSAEGKVAPLSGLSFNPVAEVRVMAPQNTDADGFTAVLRGTANSTLTAELNGKHYMTVITNSAGTATMKVDIPSGTLNGEALTLRAYDSSGSDEVKVYYYQKNATQLISLSAQYYVGDVSFVKNGRRVGSPHYSITATDIGDWWTITAVLSGTPDELVTDDVKAQIMLSNGDFRTVNMTLTDSTDLGGEDFNSFSQEDQALLLEIEQNTQDYIDTLSAIFQLKKPLNAYTDVSEIYSELGYTITENYTAAPDKDFEQLDRYVWHRYDSEKNITSVIDTEKLVRVDLDYGKIASRRAEIKSKLREAFGLTDSRKSPASVGAGDDDDGSGDITLDKAYEYIKDRVDNQEESDIEDIIADYSNSAYEYFAGDMLENVKKLGDSKLDEFIKSQALNYEKMLEAELAAGGDGTKALMQSERGIQFIASQEKWSNYLDKTGKGIDYLGDALAAWEIYKSSADINDYDEMVEQYMKVQSALFNSKLPYEDKLKLMRDGEEYIEVVMELRGVSYLDRTVNGIQLIFSTVGKFTDNPEYNIGSNVAGFIVPFAENYKNSTMKPSLEETDRLKERRFQQLLEKAKRLENEDKKKRMEELNIPYDNSAAYGSHLYAARSF